MGSYDWCQGWGSGSGTYRPKGDALQAQTALLLMIMNNDDDVHGGGKVVTFGAISGNDGGLRG